jgi:hypothetical protein
MEAAVDVADDYSLSGDKRLSLFFSASLGFARRTCGS